MEAVDRIFEIFERNGQDAYFGEDVSQLEHALQAAHFAREIGASDDLVAAALLHDIGHLLHGMEEDVADRGVDACHERVGNAWLRKYFGPGITEPVRLHVAAKRYLCAVDPAYLELLSLASLQSLHLQGGPMNARDVLTFEDNPYWEAAVLLRQWDDRAKIVGLEVAGLSSYRMLIERVAERELVGSYADG